jgi:hypothetical protein
MDAGDLVKLECEAEAVRMLAAGLEAFGPTDGDPDWLISAVWLHAGTSDFIASSSTQVLSDGYIARPLAIDASGEFARRIGGELPDIAARLMARRSDLRLPEPASPAPPTSFRPCPAGSYSMSVLIRVSERARALHRVACGLLFRFEAGSSLLVGTDVDTLAMVLSDEQPLIDRYVARCEAVLAAEYLDRYCA